MRKTRLFSILALLLMAVTGAWAQADMKKTPLTLKAKTAGTIVVWEPQSGMQYCKNDEAMTAVTSDPINVAIGDEVQFFGNGTSIASYGGTNISEGTADCYIYGNIMSLVDEEDFAIATVLTGDGAFRDLFYGNFHLYNHDTYELVLPATTLAEGCYDYMFSGCTHLTTAPELPATTLADDCYSCMFLGCTNLTTAPELPATTLATGCYYGMFAYCENLTTAPVLPATTLANYCYTNMFSGCTKLNSVTCLATNISATEATSYWLDGVDDSGTFIKAADMTSWEPNSASGIPAGWTVVDNVPDMKKTPLTLKAKTAGTIVVSSPKSGMQYSKNGGVKTELTADAGYNSSYYKWTITVAIDDKVQFFGNGTSIASYYGTGISGGTADCYIYGNIMSLVDEDEYDTATELTGNDAFNSLFYNNSHLYNHPTYKLVLPATTLTPSCYYYMFSDCTNLTTAPELPATTLATRCYMYMFNRCSNLNSVTCLATNISASNATNDWLKGVAATGTFTKAAGMTSWTTGASGIPSGWTKNNIATLTDGSSIADQLKCPGELCEVTYSRAFTADKPSTVCLPFAYAPKTGETFYTFSGITKEGDEYVATMTVYAGATLAANTPYLYKSATTGDTDFSGTYTIPATIAAGTTTSGDWKFVGTYDTQSWTTAPTGIYGFSAQNTGGISQGEFVKVGAYVRIKPMRAYLKYKDGGDDYTGAPMMAPRRAAETLPERISVRLIDADGEVTGIGTLETRTGEVTLDGWYTLDGTRLSGQPTQKGIFVNNGKKVVIK